MTGHTIPILIKRSLELFYFSFYDERGLFREVVERGK
jgi:hypothetical protein